MGKGVIVLGRGPWGPLWGEGWVGNVHGEKGSSFGTGPLGAPGWDGVGEECCMGKRE